MFARRPSMSVRVRLSETSVVSRNCFSASHDVRKRSPSAIVLTLLVTLVVMANVGVLPLQPVASAAGSKPVKQAMFYNPPSDMSASTVAAKADFLIYNQGQESHIGQLRDSGYTGKVVQYMLSNEVMGPGPYRNSSASCNTSYVPWLNNAADQVGDFCRYVHPNESWFLHNGNGDRLYGRSSAGTWYHMNPASSGWRNFVLSRIKRRLQSTAYAGMFLDNVALSLSKVKSQLVNSNGTVKEFSSTDAYRNAFIGYLSSLSASLRPEKLLWANFIADPNDGANWNPYMKYLDGGMFEAFATGYGSGLSAEKWNNNLKQAESILASSKGVLAESLGKYDDLTRQKFALASYLLIVNSKAYFRYSRPYTTWHQYSNYNVTLGAPSAKRFQSGSIWKRNFECGYVTVDPVARVGKIVQTCTTSPSSTAAADETIINVPQDEPLAGELPDSGTPVLADDPTSARIDDSTLTTIPDDVEVELPADDDTFVDGFPGEPVDEASMEIPDDAVPGGCSSTSEPVSTGGGDQQPCQPQTQ